MTGESCSPPNGAIDPDETVSVSFALANAGSGPTTNLVATLLPTGGVQTPSGPQTYGVVPTDGSSVARTFTFVPAGTCGGTVTATLQLQDGADRPRHVSFPLPLGTTVGDSVGPFANAASITHPATPAGHPLPVVDQRLGDRRHGDQGDRVSSSAEPHLPGDVDVLLVGPAGQRIILMSDVGGGTDVGQRQPHLRRRRRRRSCRRRSSPAPSADQLGHGRPLRRAGPGRAVRRALSDFNGTNPNGTWQLFVVDDAGGDLGSIAGGWSLTLPDRRPGLLQPGLLAGLPGADHAGKRPRPLQRRRDLRSSRV